MKNLYITMYTTRKIKPEINENNTIIKSNFKQLEYIFLFIYKYRKTWKKMKFYEDINNKIKTMYRKFITW